MRCAGSGEHVGLIGGGLPVVGRGGAVRTVEYERCSQCNRQVSVTPNGNMRAHNAPRSKGA